VPAAFFVDAVIVGVWRVLIIHNAYINRLWKRVFG
jgi:hypothetical protein